MTGDLHAETVSAPADCEALIPEWWQLWRVSPTATPFQSPAWLLPWWRAFAPGELRVITVRQSGRLVGLAPLYLERGACGRRLLPVGISLSDYVDILLDPDIAEAAATALCRHLASLADWDALELVDLLPGAAALRLPVPAACDEAQQRSSACPVLVLADPAGAQDHGIPPGKLRDVRQARHRAARRGEVVIIDGDRLNAHRMFSELVRLHRARWQAREEAGVLADPRVVGFHQEALPLLLEANLARLHALLIAGEVTAVYYGLLHRERAYAYLGGFDPAFSFESPGTILIGHAIAAAQRDGAREFDLLRGRESYKYSWGARDRWNVRRTFTRQATYARAS